MVKFRYKQVLEICLFVHVSIISISALFPCLLSIGNGNVGVVATDGSFLHLALIHPNMNWLKLPFSPLVTAKVGDVPKPKGTVILDIR